MPFSYGCALRSNASMSVAHGCAFWDNASMCSSAGSRPRPRSRRPARCVLLTAVMDALAKQAGLQQQPQRETDDDDAISTVDMDGLQRRDWDMVNGNL